MTGVPPADSLIVRIIGVGCSSSREHSSTSFLLEYAGQKLAIDCPHPILHQVHDAGGGDARLIDDWIITHIHADHASGLESLAFSRWYGAHKKTNVVGVGAVLEDLLQIHDVSALSKQTTITGERDPLRARDVYNSVLLRYDEPVQLGLFSVEIAKATHVVPTTAVRVTAPNGRSFAYSADTVFDSELLSWLASADVFAHDCAGGPIHASCDELLLETPVQDRSRCLLVHRSDLSAGTVYNMREAGFVIPQAGHTVTLAQDGTLEHRALRINN